MLQSKWKSAVGIWGFIIAPDDPRVFRTVYPDGAYHTYTEDERRDVSPAGRI